MYKKSDEYKLADACDFGTITPEELLRDRLIFGIRDNKVRERLLRESHLTLAKTDEICRASESMLAQMKIVGDNTGPPVNAITRLGKPHAPFKGKRKVSYGDNASSKECGNCGRKHSFMSKDTCPAFGKTCVNCGKLNHFTAMCRGKKTMETPQSVRAIAEEASDEDEVNQTQKVGTANSLDDPQLVTLKLESGNYLRFQPHTGAQCNTIPVHLYKEAFRDFNMDRVQPPKTAIAIYGGSKWSAACAFGFGVGTIGANLIASW